MDAQLTTVFISQQSHFKRPIQGLGHSMATNCGEKKNRLLSHTNPILSQFPVFDESNNAENVKK